LQQQDNKNNNNRNKKERRAIDINYPKQGTLSFAPSVAQDVSTQSQELEHPQTQTQAQTQTQVQAQAQAQAQEQVINSNPTNDVKDFVITDEFAQNVLGKGTKLEKFQTNLEIIKTLKNIEHEKRSATEQEQQLLQNYKFMALYSERVAKKLDLLVQGIASLTTSWHTHLYQDITIFGQKSTIHLENNAFYNNGEMYLFGCILANFYAQCAPVNLFHFLDVVNLANKEVYSWQLLSN